METFPISEVPFPEVTVCPPLGSNTALKYDLMTADNITLKRSQTHLLGNKENVVFTIIRLKKGFCKS